MMGENRTNSYDSRYWALVPRENLIGRPLFIYWSFIKPEDLQYRTSLADRSKFALHQALHILDDTRWSRSFQLVE